MKPILSEQWPSPLNHEPDHDIREALRNACELLGGMTAWLARLDGAGYHMLVRLEPPFWIDPDMHTALEIMADRLPPKESQVKLWRGYTLLLTSIQAQQELSGSLYSLGMLFMGTFDLTERRAGVVEGLVCSMHVLISRSLQETSGRPPTEEAAPSVVCSCCRRISTPQYGWMHWDDLRLIETGFASSHTVCERCAAALYEEVLDGRE